MQKSRIIGKRDNTILITLFLLALLAGMLTGCREQFSSPLPTPSGEIPATPTPGSEEIQARAAAGEWLRANAIPFETAEPGGGFEDLMPLKDIIGDARIVALGEATHGTHEFFQMKHRLVEFLVEEMGFNVFAMEAGWAEANPINDYVQNGPCQGNEAKLLADMGYWTWNTQEVLDMIRWMCAHNQDPGDAPEISFAGFDMQTPDVAIANVTSYLKEVESSYTETAIDRYSCIRSPGRQSSYARLSDEERKTCRNGLREVLDHLVAERETYEERSSPEEFAVAEQSARIVLQAEDVLADETHTGDRDRYMAENVVWLLEQAGPDARIILWAHNAHVANGTLWDKRSMGAHLKEIYGEGMVNFGFAFDHGRFNAFNATSHSSETGQYVGFKDLHSHEVPPAPQGSYEWYLRAAKMPRMILVLRDVSGSSPATEWLMEPHKFRFIGAVYDDDAPEEYFRDADLTTEFNAIIYFEETTPSMLLSRMSH